MHVKTLTDYLTESAFESYHYEGLSIKAQIKADESKIKRVTKIQSVPGSNEGHFLTLEIWSNYTEDIPLVICFRSHSSNITEIITKISTLVHSYPQFFN